MVFTRSLSFGIFAAFVATSAVAGDGNQIYLEQRNASGALSGNTISIDQSAASNSAVVGSPWTTDAIKQAAEGPLEAHASDPSTSGGNTFSPALQSGSGNTAAISMTGSGGQVLFHQSGTQGNVAAISVIGSATADFFQDGSGNDGSIDVEGTGAFALLHQIGDGNRGEVTARGPNANAELTQIGNDGDFSLTVPSDTSVVYQVEGNGVTQLRSGASVISNANSVIVRQTAY